ncbi:ATP-grasp domain-containing protein [Allonocardiopsis opalescens]|uniref:Uncharacterized protein DUF4343 n=1 Tax=Allonocardiopsis opalescens TaxID=1144618 RepID=A0A2T0Q7I2_9ACTN|nr:ATP-grasp domain-containing protein [Allonocardiopsis opalescens]PRX99683.1 uncharacterized protein DUF4343 [Allonocardiopsis opalescens]
MTYTGGAGRPSGRDSYIPAMSATLPSPMGVRAALVDGVRFAVPTIAGVSRTNTIHDVRAQTLGPVRAAHDGRPGPDCPDPLSARAAPEPGGAPAEAAPPWATVERTGPLALAPWYTPTAELLAGAARRRGMEVVGLPGDGRPPAGLRGRAVHYYGGPGYARRVAAELDLALLEADQDWLTGLPETVTRRRVTAATLAEARRLTRPAFVKPPRDKGFPAAVYPGGGALAEIGLPAGTPVQIAEVVAFTREFRLFLLDGEVRAGSQYATHGVLDARPLAGHPDRAAVLGFTADLLAAHGGTLPSAVVVDVGPVADPVTGSVRGWGVVEANMAWFSSAYAAEPDGVLDTVLRAAGPRAAVAARDRPFVRSRP